MRNYTEYNQTKPLYLYALLGSSELPGRCFVSCAESLSIGSNGYSVKSGIEFTNQENQAERSL